MPEHALPKSPQVPTRPQGSPSAWRVAKAAGSFRMAKDPFVSPALENYLSSEPEQHWVVRDALAFTPKPSQGDVLIGLLANHDSSVRQSALLALRRLVPVLWARHADRVSEMLTDKIPEIRMAALIALFHLDASELELQARPLGKELAKMLPYADSNNFLFKDVRRALLAFNFSSMYGNS